MAKKTSKKPAKVNGRMPAKKSGKKVTKKTAKNTGKKGPASAKKSMAAKKSSSKKAAAKKAATGKRRRTRHAARNAGGPYPVTTGKGASPAEIGADLIAMLRAGKNDEEIWDKWFHADFESIEGHGQGWSGRDAVQQKVAGWSGQHTIHDLKIDGPFVGATGFGVRYSMDATNTATGHRSTINEFGYYLVRDGKVIREEFFYAQ